MRRIQTSWAFLGSTNATGIEIRNTVTGNPERSQVWRSATELARSSTSRG